MSASTITVVFWILVGISFLGMLAVFGSGLSSGPNGGAVGAWLVVFPLLYLVGLGVVFTMAKSDGTRVVCLALVALPLFSMGSSILTERKEKQKEEERYERAASGADYFREPAQMRLAAALRAGNVEQVKALLPAAGDVNKVYGETTLLLYALERGQGSEAARFAVVKTLLEAGANPNVPPGKPLAAVSYKGREMVELLLEAGADVNYVGTDGEPYWWTWLHDDTKGEMVPLMLAHGANLQLRVRGFGPVSQAAHRGSWKTLLLLMEAGAPYKGEPSAYDGTLYDDVKRAGAPEAVKALAMMEAGAR